MLRANPKKASLKSKVAKKTTTKKAPVKKQQKRALTTKKANVKSSITSPSSTPSSFAAQLAQGTDILSFPTLQSANFTTGPKQVAFKSNFAEAMNSFTQQQLTSPLNTSNLTTQQRNMKIRSLQVAYIKYWLCRRGLFYEDIFEEVPSIRLAINILPADVRKDRLRRLIRSCDLDLKMVWLPEAMQQYDPLMSYGLDDAIMRVDLFSTQSANYV